MATNKGPVLICRAFVAMNAGFRSAPKAALRLLSSTHANKCYSFAAPGHPVFEFPIGKIRTREHLITNQVYPLKIQDRGRDFSDAPIANDRHVGPAAA